MQGNSKNKVRMVVLAIFAIGFASGLLKQRDAGLASNFHGRISDEQQVDRTARNSPGLSARYEYQSSKLSLRPPTSACLH